MNFLKNKQTKFSSGRTTFKVPKLSNSGTGFEVTHSLLIMESFGGSNSGFATQPLMDLRARLSTPGASGGRSCTLKPTFIHVGICKEIILLFCTFVNVFTSYFMLGISTLSELTSLNPFPNATYRHVLGRAQMVNVRVNTKFQIFRTLNLALKFTLLNHFGRLLTLFVIDKIIHTWILENKNFPRF